MRSIKLNGVYEVGSLEHGIFTNLIESSSSLGKINLGFVDLSEKNLKDLSKLIFQCTNLKSIDLSGNNVVGSYEHEIFTNLIKSSSTLQHIDLFNVNLCEKNSLELSKLKCFCQGLL